MCVMSDYCIGTVINKIVFKQDALQLLEINLLCRTALLQLQSHVSGASGQFLASLETTSFSCNKNKVYWFVMTLCTVILQS